MTAATANVTMQGISVPASSVNPNEFFKRTRRQVFLQRTIPQSAGPGSTDTITILQTGVLSEVIVRLVGTIVVTLPTGTCASTWAWPYDLVRAARFSANGVANLINCSGWHLKARDIMRRGALDDRGVPQGIGGASPGTSRTQGTLSLASESWGVGQAVTAIPAGTYNFDLQIPIPVAHDPVNLLGAIFAQTTSTALELNLDYNPLGSLFTLTGTATVALAYSATVEAVVFSLPANPAGGIFVPNLSAFHQLIASKAPNAISVGANEIKLAGSGPGRQLMRLFFRTMNGTVPSALPVNATNYSQPYWRFGGNTTPEQWTDGQDLREWNERLFNTDFGGTEGFAVLDWDSQWAFRDSIDEATASELRFGFTIPQGVSLTSPYTEYVQEVILAGTTAA